VRKVEQPPGIVLCCDDRHVRTAACALPGSPALQQVVTQERAPYQRQTGAECRWRLISRPIHDNRVGLGVIVREIAALRLVQKNWPFRVTINWN
jgi:hypothetical protein